MANIQHSTLPSSAVHEPKHITINGVGASGRVITNSSSTVGVSEYRRLNGEDISNLVSEMMVLERDASVAQVHYIPTTFSGAIIGFAAIVNDGITTSANTYELQIDGVTVTNSPITLTTTPGTGGDPGDIVTSAPTAPNTFDVGQALTIVNTAAGNTDAGVDIRFVITVTRG